MRNLCRQTMKMNIFLIITIQLFVICSVFASPTEENHTNSIHKTFHSHQNEIPQMRNKDKNSNIKQEHDIKNSDNPSTQENKMADDLMAEYDMALDLENQEDFQKLLTVLSRAAHPRVADKVNIQG